MVQKIKSVWNKTNSENSAQTGQNTPSLAVRFIGAPDDRGISNVGGRLGSGHAPQTIRAMLTEFMLGLENNLENIRVQKGFDIALGASIEDGHQALREAVRTAIEENVCPIVLGGGHDYGFPHLAGVADSCSNKIGVINVDAHLDLRPKNEKGITSGSPFFLALESGVLQPNRFVEFGIQPHCNAPEFYEYAQKKKIQTIFLSDLRKGSSSPTKAFEKCLSMVSKSGHKVVVSFDVDSVQMSQAPGVSAPQADGFTAAEFLEMATLAGKHTAVASIGFFELSPDLDLNQMTTRLVCTAIHRFLSAFSLRRVSTRKFSVPLKRSK